MEFYLLDAGGAGLVFAALILFIVVAVTIEAIIMLLMKYNNAGKAFLDSLLVNLASLIVGFLFASVSGDLFNMTDSVMMNWVLLYGLTLVVEFPILYLLNRRHSWRRTLLTAAIMNVTSYIILFFFVEGVNL